MMSTNKRLMALMKGHSLTSQQVADLVQVKLVTVQHWRQTPGNVGHNSMPPGLLELLTIKLGEVKSSTNQTGEKR
jgi:hypothetical protein